MKLINRLIHQSILTKSALVQALLRNALKRALEDKLNGR